MKVNQISDTYWEVSEGAKWWTVKYLTHKPFGSFWYITTKRGAEIAPNGKLGRSLVAAVEEHRNPVGNV